MARSRFDQRRALFELLPKRNLIALLYEFTHRLVDKAAAASGLRDPIYKPNGLFGQRYV